MQPDPEAVPEERPIPKAEVEPSPAEAIDTHCHLFLMEQDPAEAVAEAKAAGVGSLVCVGIDPDSSRRSLELAESFRGVFATAGVHPHTASAFDQEAGSAIEELLAHPLVVGVGETGLDYYRRLSPVEDQQRAFRTHIALSRESDKPLVVHVRDAWDDAMRMLEVNQADRVVLHCFTGGPEIAREAERRGYVVSFAGNLTYPNAEAVRAAAAALDPGAVVVETDSPFLPPQTHRGQANRPPNVMAVVRALAELRGEGEAQVVAATRDAARRAFTLIR